MRNLFLCMIFVLLGTVSFASPSAFKTTSNEAALLNLTIDETVEYEMIVLSKEEFNELQIDEPGDVWLVCWDLNEDWMYCVVAIEV